MAMVSIDIAASSAAKKSLRIQITSFAAQPVPAQGFSSTQHAVDRLASRPQSPKAIAYPS